MEREDFVNISSLSAVNHNVPLRSFRLNLNDVESLKIERENNGIVYYYIELGNGRTIKTDEQDGTSVLGKLREKTTREYAKKK